MIKFLLKHPRTVTTVLGVGVLIVVGILLFVIYKCPISDQLLLANYGTIFTIIGAGFTVINTLVVIYLMIWLYHKDSDISLLPIVNEMHRDMLTLTKLFKIENDFFVDKHYDCCVAIQFSEQHEDLYKKQIDELDEVIQNMEPLVQAFNGFRKQVKTKNDYDVESCKSYSELISTLIGELSLDSPSSNYKLAFTEGNKVEADEIDMLEVAKSSALQKIDELILMFPPVSNK